MLQRCSYTSCGLCVLMCAYVCAAETLCFTQNRTCLRLWQCQCLCLLQWLLSEIDMTIYGNVSAQTCLQHRQRCECGLKVLASCVVNCAVTSSAEFVLLLLLLLLLTYFLCLFFESPCAKTLRTSQSSRVRDTGDKYAFRRHCPALPKLHLI